MLETVNEKLAAIMGIIVSLTFLLPQCRRFVCRVWKGVVFMFTAPWVILQKVDALALIVHEVRHQVFPNNGSSLPDGLKRLEIGQARLESYRQHEFWKQPRPGLEMDAEGRVNLASEAACRLFKVSNPDELYSKSWNQYLDRNHVDSFMRAFRETAACSSIFRFCVLIYDESRQCRGEWEFRATPIEGADPVLYSGFFTPVDDAAKEIAARAGWQV